MFMALIAMLALSRAEIIAWMKAPVLNMSQGLVRVYADCPEDMRRTYQMPMARMACDLASTLYKGTGVQERRFNRPGIIIHVGSVRTNLQEVAVRVETNGTDVSTHIYARSPAYVNVTNLRLEVAKAFMRSVLGKESSAEEISSVLRAADPRTRIEDERVKLEQWLQGRGGHRDEDAFQLMRKVLEPGKASRRDILVFASRLYLYPETYDRPFAGSVDCVSFRDAVKLAKIDPRVRFSAYLKARELPVFGGGRGQALLLAAQAYSEFLKELVKGEKTEEDLLSMLDQADGLLRLAEQDTVDAAK